MADWLFSTNRLSGWEVILELAVWKLEAAKVMRTLIFGDLGHVRSFGANLTSFCLHEDLKKTSPSEEEIIVFPMPHIGARYSNLWKLAKQLPPSVSRSLRDSRLAFKTIAPASIEYKNVHYNNEFSGVLPNTLPEFQNLGPFLAKSDLLREIEKNVRMSDRVIINGEGNIVNHIGNLDVGYRVGARFLFFAMFLCIRERIPFSLVNCTIDPKNEIVDEVLGYALPFASHVSVREPISFDYATKHLSLSNVHEGADASVGFDFGPLSAESNGVASGASIVLGDSSGLRGNGAVVAKELERLIVKFQGLGFRVKLLDCSTPYSNIIGKLSSQYDCEWLSDHWLTFRSLQQNIRDASLLVSGRWHPSILAASVGVPTVMYGSDSCKTRGFSARMKAPFLNGGLEGVYEQFSVIEQELVSERRYEVLAASLDWSKQRVENLRRPASV